MARSPVVVRELTPTRFRDLEQLFGPHGACVTCLYVAPPHRGRGVTARLLQAAVRHAFAHGAPAVEAYPVTAAEGRADTALYTGVITTYQRLGFEAVARPPGARSVVRLRAPVRTRPRRRP